MVGLLLAPLADGVPVVAADGEWLPAQSLVDGARTFTAGGCSACHTGPGLAALPGPVGGVADLAGIFWNHGSAPRAAAPHLSVDQTRTLAGYLFAREFLDRPGDPARGATLFTERACALCHQLRGRGGTIGPRLDELGPYATGLFLASALWEHGPAMDAKIADLHVTRAQLGADDIDDLLALLRQTREPTTSLAQLAAQAGSPRAGKAIFARKGCQDCHAIAGVGGTSGPDLGVRRPGWRIAALVAALWNHGPGMRRDMRAVGIPVPELTDREVADVVAYLLFVQYLNVSGDAARGRVLFHDRSCADCHAAGGTARPLAGSPLARAPLLWATATWNHGPIGDDRAWPRFAGDEMRDVLAFLRAAGDSP